MGGALGTFAPLLTPLAAVQGRKAALVERLLQEVVPHEPTPSAAALDATSGINISKYLRISLSISEYLRTSQNISKYLRPQLLRSAGHAGPRPERPGRRAAWSGLLLRSSGRAPQPLSPFAAAQVPGPWPSRSTSPSGAAASPLCTSCWPCTARQTAPHGGALRCFGRPPNLGNISHLGPLKVS
eukprot:SAG31_NODE_2930_length_4898_cov_3.710356_2_plen_184_part_00